MADAEKPSQYCPCKNYCKHDFLIDIINDPKFETAEEILISLQKGDQAAVIFIWNEEASRYHVVQTN